jgi:hypothetical protein
MKMLHLKNGSVQPAPSVATTMKALDHLWGQGVVGLTALYDLYERSKNADHRIAEGVLETLKTLALVQPDGSIHDTVRNVVLSAVSGEGIDIAMASPLKETA